jgi:micrococcal nuclease
MRYFLILLMSVAVCYSFDPTINRDIYTAEVVSVYDGDTVVVDIHLGLDVVLVAQRIRLLGINAPEVRGESRPEGLKAKDYLASLLAGYPYCLQVNMCDRDKYGRWLGIFHIKVQDSWKNANQMMIQDGYAVEYR